jgi:hypothetical protein
MYCMPFACVKPDSLLGVGCCVILAQCGLHQGRISFQPTRLGRPISGNQCPSVPGCPSPGAYTGLHPPHPLHLVRYLNAVLHGATRAVLLRPCVHVATEHVRCWKPTWGLAVDVEGIHWGSCRSSLLHVSYHMRTRHCRIDCTMAGLPFMVCMASFLHSNHHSHSHRYVPQ